MTKNPQFSCFLARLLEPCWLHFSLLGASWALLALLAAFVLALGRFLRPLSRFGLVPELTGLDFGGVLGGFGGPKRRFFEVFAYKQNSTAQML